ncbi:MAG: molybdopterin biosynthesis protein [Pirellulaceae bacterium]|nr:molybdopterin biosynthesis protein [Pirellulaceae bacterium]
MTPKSSTSQQQFLNVIDRDEAERRFHAAISRSPRAEEVVSLETAWGRVLSRDVTSQIDVPSFDRSNVDGFALRAEDTFGATEEIPRALRLLDEVLATAIVPQSTVTSGTAVPIATGAMLPRGANAVVMVEHTETEGKLVRVNRSLTPGTAVAFAGTDIGVGETVLRAGELLTSRETGVLAAIGADKVFVWRRPRVAIASTGDEIIAPGKAMRPGMVFDSNAQILSDAVRELGGVPVNLGIIHDDRSALEETVQHAIATADVVLLSGGTSKGAGDISYQVVQQLDDPGIVAHGVALKPGKPICLAASQGKPVVILPGFPTSAVFTFHEFVAPVIRQMSGLPPQRHGVVKANMATQINSEIGRTEYLLVGLVGADTQQEPAQLTAYPMGKGSGSVTTFSRADGFVTLDRHEELIEQGSAVEVRLLGRDLEVADLVVIGSHCLGLDLLLSELQQLGFRSKFLAVGSTAGLYAVERGECDVAGIHLLDEASGEYNSPFLKPGMSLISGYHRSQGLVFRQGDARFEGKQVASAVAMAKEDANTLMVNRNQGSGTRVLIDQLLAGFQPDGYAVQARSHNAVAAAIAQRRADWGIAIQRVADQANLGFLPLTDERFDFVAPESRLERPAVKQLRQLLQSDKIIQRLAALGLTQ